MKGVWKHLFFIERVLAVIGTKVFGSNESFKQAVTGSASARPDDGSMVDNMYKGQ